MPRIKTVYFCSSCGNETPKWQGKCPACGQWNTMVEHTERPSPAGRAKSSPVDVSRTPKRLQDVDSNFEIRFTTGIGELDRVLGGGAVSGSLVLVGGAPGIGKSTLLLQICNSLCADRKVLYVSGEESEQQLKIRAQRVGVMPENLYILSETGLAEILDATESLSPDILIVDSIQTLYSDTCESTPGSITQVKECTLALMQLSKSQGITVFVVGHINKDGAIAGPKVLEHMVDCVLYFEGDHNSQYRLLRAAKNRFGSTNEIGVFEMRNCGLFEVPNPSLMLLEGRPEGASGTCVTCVMEGTRPILAEVQALVTKTSYNVPKRTSDGFDYNRAALLMAVAEKRAGIKLSAFDAYVNVIGGLRLDEPGADLAIALALASSYRDAPVPSDLVAIGEIGLTGEIRSVSNLTQRVAEVSRLGFKSCILPKNTTEKLQLPPGLTAFYVKNLREAIEIAL